MAAASDLRSLPAARRSSEDRDRSGCFANVVLGLEYEFTELNTHGEVVPCPACGVGVGFGTPVISNDVTINSVMARASYLFGGED